MADEKKCRAINHPNLAPGWACGECKTYNGDNRNECKFCNHTRCDNPSVKGLISKTETGYVITPVKLTGDKSKAN
jgi:hypothetical protein